MQHDRALASLLLAVVRRRWPEAEAGAPIAAREPESFVELCRTSDVHPWVDRLVGGRPALATALGPGVVERLATLRQRVRRDNVLLLARAAEALDALRRAGIVPLALKGLDFLHRLYDRADERTIDDVDLLVREAELERALDALREAGFRTPPEAQTAHYVRSSHHLPLTAPGPVGVEFELHWNLAQRGRYAIDPGSLFARARPLVVDGRELLRLDDVDAVAHLLVHHVSHYFDRRLKWLVDLERIDEASRIDWDAVARRVREWGGSAACGAALAHLARLAPDRIPRRARAALPHAAWRRALAAPLASRHPLELYRATRRRRVQLYLAAVLLEHPAHLPAWLWHRAKRDRRESEHPLDPGARRRAT